MNQSETGTGVPRVRGGLKTGDKTSGEYGNMCRGGRMFAPTKLWKRWYRKIKIQQPDSSCSNIANNSLSASTDSQNFESKTKVDSKKEKCKPMTKVVIRRLPPSMTQAQFVEQISPLPDNDYLYFVKADMSLGQHAFSRAYINFIDQQQIFDFREKFDNYVFVDAKGTEYPAVVEFAPFQRLPKKRIGKKKEMKCGNIEAEPYYISFIESLKNQETDAAIAQPKTEYSFQPFENAQKKVTSTPLLEFLKQRKQDKQRVRDEKREERKRRDLEKRKAKDEPTISKVLKNPDVERELGRENKENKEEKEKIIPVKDLTKNRKKDEVKIREKPLVIRERETKVPSKNYRDEKKYQERDVKNQKKYEEKKIYNRKDDNKDYLQKDDKKNHEIVNKLTKDDVKDKKIEEKKGKSYEKMRKEKRKIAENKKQIIDNQKDLSKKDDYEHKKIEIIKRDVEIIHKQIEKINDNSIEVKKDIKKKKFKETDDKKIIGDTEKCDEQIDEIPMQIDLDENVKSTKTNKRDNKKIKRRSSLESGGDVIDNDNVHLRRHKSLDGDDDDDNLQKNQDYCKNKNKKESKTERRIRNKDRPAMEIYRPGMGRFSKQRLEREKPTSDERSYSSESPTPGAKSSMKSAVSSSSIDTKIIESTSATLKRSTSRDGP
ncbi:regulator of nonsense transcripts 3B-like [Aphidius gifuensis]|uniref:regulator of nonsense transcripts 3B-like n=1 Tax=Aphidius gifuensis TaxID=684658 RepID=UPI001CDD34F0|nr:regulator of nonsense transcripts 3B-like [Aphidius gifuensis]